MPLSPRPRRLWRDVILFDGLQQLPEPMAVPPSWLVLMVGIVVGPQLSGVMTAPSMPV